MKRLSSFCAALAIAGAAMAQQTAAKDAVVRVWAKISRSPLKIELKWDMFATAQSIKVYKRALTDPTWTSVATLAATDTSYVVPSPTLGQPTEWRIQKDIYNGSNQLINYCNGYVYTGVDVPEEHSRGDLLMLLDQKANDSLKTEIGLAMADMTADGWVVDTAVIQSNMAADKVKNRVKNWFIAKNNPTALFIFGHVAVPYSGDMQGTGVATVPMDGHQPDHNGAWVADAYYADMDGAYTDLVTNVSATRAANQNNPGDGKFDQIFLPSNVELEVSRVDLYNLPSFAKTEIQLLKQYLDKMHAYKIAAWNIPRRGFIDDRLGYFGAEAPARGAWHSLVPAFGNNITEGSYFAVLKTSPYLVAHEVSTGSYTQYVGVGSTADYKDTVKAVFNSSFGSYFGDWDISDNILRACLASPGYTLTNCWNGRPMFIFHHMALGKSIGFSVKTSQNNYSDGFTPEVYPVLFGGGRLHISMQGDPTLRLHMVKMPANLNAAARSGGVQGVDLNWTASADSRIVGYNVYRAPTAKGPFVLVNSSRISGTSATDYHPLANSSVYMVRAVKLDSSASGTYFNQSLGVFKTLNYSGPVSVNGFAEESLKIYPNPASDRVSIEAGANFAHAQYSISDRNGKLIRSGQMNGQRTLVLNSSQIASGIYFINLNNGLELASGKIVIAK